MTYPYAGCIFSAHHTPAVALHIISAVADRFWNLKSSSTTPPYNRGASGAGARATASASDETDGFLGPYGNRT